MGNIVKTDLDLDQNQLKNARLENSSTTPSSPMVGQIIFNTTLGTILIWDGTTWLSAGAPTTPTLQEVLAQGNETQGSDIIITAPSDRLVFTSNSGRNFLQANPLSGNKFISLQDKSGTLALMSDINAPQSLNKVLTVDRRTGGKDIEISSGDKIMFSPSLGDTSLVPTNATGDHTATLQAKTGTIALLTDITTIVDITYIDLKSLQSGNTLEPGITYHITDRDIWILALDTNLLSTICRRKMSIVKDESYTPHNVSGGFFPPHYLGIYGQTYNQGSVPNSQAGFYGIQYYVIWGGKIWQRQTTGSDTKINDSTLGSGWVVVDSGNTVEYDQKIFTIEYDFEKDIIWTQSDDRGNVIKNFNNSTFNIDVTDWGNSKIVNNECYGVFNNFQSPNSPATISNNSNNGVISNNSNSGVISGNNNNGDINNNSNTSYINNNSNTGYINNNTNIGSIDSNFNTDRIYSNSNGGNIINNSNAGYIQSNSNNGDIQSNSNLGVIYNNSNTSYIKENKNLGNITSNNSNVTFIADNSNAGYIQSNSNNGYIQSNSNLGVIYNNSNRGAILNNSNTLSIISNSNNGYIQYNSNNGVISGNSNTGAIQNNSNTDNIQYNSNRGFINSNSNNGYINSNTNSGNIDINSNTGYIQYNSNRGYINNNSNNGNINNNQSYSTYAMNIHTNNNNGYIGYNRPMANGVAIQYNNNNGRIGGTSIVNRYGLIESTYEDK